MISSSSLRFMDDDSAPLPSPIAAAEPPPEAAQPNVFVRTLSTPPGLPWEQGRVADLEARHGSPLPIAEVVYLLRRLDGWRPGSPGRFAAFYVLANEVDGRLDASAEVDGRDIAVTFVTGGARIAQAGQAALRVAAIVALGVVVAWSAGAAFTRRGETEAAIQLVEQRATGKLKRAETARRGGDLDRLLTQELNRGTRLRDVLGDLAWVSNATAPGARIDALHWEPGFMAVAAKGEASPFQAAADRQVRRAGRPLRPGVWLWGVTDATPQDVAPVTAEMKP